MKKETYFKKMSNFGKNVAAIVTTPYKIRKDTANFEILKAANQSKDAPQFDASGKPTDAFKYKVAADALKIKMDKKK